jgi:DNA-binding beta-propeller fold protein YncE
MRRVVVLGLVGALAFTFVGSPASRAATIASSWPVGKAPLGLAFDSSTGKVYVANSETVMANGNGRISVVDPATGSVGSLTTSFNANALLVDASSRRLYSSSASLLSTDTAVDVFDLDGVAAPTAIPDIGGFGLGLDAQAGLLFAGGYSLTVVDTTTYEGKATLPPPPAGPWFGVAVDPGQHRLYLSNGAPSARGLFVYDYDANGALSPQPEVELATSVRSALVVDPVGHHIFAAGSDRGGGAASAFYDIDPDTLQIAHTLALSGFPMGMALAPGTNLIYASVTTSETTGRVYVIDGATFVVTDVIPLTAFAPGQPLLHTDGRLYVGNYNRRTGIDSNLVALEPNNHAPVFQSFALTPTYPTTNETLHADATATDPDLRAMGAADPTTLSYAWFRNGTLIAGETGSTLDLRVAGNGDHGDAIAVRVTASDGQQSSSRTASVDVVNTAPSVTVSLSSSSPKTNDVLTATAVGTDVDGDALTYTYTWSVNGVIKRTATTAVATDRFDLKVKGHGDKGDVVTVSVTAWDGAATSTAATASATVR